MRKVFAVVAFFIIAVIPQAAFAQNDAVRIVPSCGGPFDKCGFIRMDGSERKEEIIPRQYEAGLPFSEGLAAVRINGQWGFINMKGEVVITPQFDLVGSFAHDLAEVLIDEKVGVINRQGDLVIKPQFARAIPLSKDVVIAQPGNWQSPYVQGAEKLPNIRDMLIFDRGLSGLYSVKTGWITQPEWEFSIFDRTGKISLIWAKHKGRDALYGLMRTDGSWQVKPKYDHVQWLCEDRAIVSERNIWGAVDPEGKLVVPLRFEWLGYWEDGLGLTRDSAAQKEGLVDKTGNLVGGRFFDKVGRGKSGIGEVMIDGLWHGIDLQGNIVAHPNENKVFKECPSGLKLVYVSGKLQFRDSNDKPTVPFLHDPVTLYGFDCNKITSVKHNGKWGYVDRKGYLLFDPPAFDNQYDFADGYAPVQKNKKWGIINEQGKFTVQPTYDELRYVGNSIFKAKLASRDFWVDTDGIEQAEPIDPERERLERAYCLSCPGSLKIIPNNAKGDLWGIADENGGIIIKPTYRAISCFKNGVAWAPNDAKRQWCPVDSNGTLQDFPKCVASYYPYMISHHHPEQLAADPYESSVLWSRALLELGAGLRKQPPQMIGDGIRGRGSFPATCR
ncbi:WG repeat-containing protein [Deltaproteobacteria bacterium OttesenSCG-928-K17]|nr:WG repeat-containing protein [Deltaproteobacteria bacterium OttesenSCG-928-K17]